MKINIDKMSKTAVCLLCFLILVLPLVSAHVPVRSGDNISLEQAKQIEDPFKSWVYYSKLSNKDEVRYYEFDLQQGERLKLSTLTPESGQFSPTLVIMRGDLDSNDEIPEKVEFHEDHGFIRIDPEKGGIEYEPFTPGAYYTVLDYSTNIVSGGKYFIAIYEDSGLIGSFGLVVGYLERFSPLEIVKVPLDVIWIHLWEGQSYLMMFYPPLISVLAGGIYLRSKLKTILIT